MPRTRILLNPHAGTALPLAEFRARVESLLPGTEVAPSSQNVSLSDLAAQAVRDGVETIIAAGGDGTMNCVLNGIAPHFSGIRMGLLPLGTGNDFARTINVPTDLDHGLAVLREAQVQVIDVVKLTAGETTHYMLNVSAGGFSTKVSEAATDAKDIWGPFCYARSFLGALPELDDYQTEIRLDDSELLEMLAFNITAANGRYVAGGVPIAPTAELDDGLLDLIILPAASLRELTVLGPATLLGRHLESDKILFRRARKVEIRSTPPMQFNADGELLPPATITFEVLPRVLSFIVGPQPLQE